MKAVVVNAPMDFEIKDVPVPQCDEQGLIIKVLACGLCGSDLRTLRSGHRKVKLPWIIGHEISGMVEQTGRTYSGEFKEGDMLSVAPLVFCGKCEFCLEQRYELCENYLEIAQAWPGGFAEYMAVPAEALKLGTIRAVPENLDPAVAAIAEPISSCIHAQEKGGVAKGDTVVVIGTGPIGCTHVELARANGAKRIIAADISESRLRFCGAFEPDHLINAAEADLVEEVKRLTDGRGAEVVITANPVPSTQVEAVEMAKKAGRILIFGGLPADNCRPAIDMNLVHYNALHIIGTTIFAPRHHEMAIKLLAEGKIRGEKLISHKFDLSRFREGAMMALEGKVLKAVFLP